MNSETARPRLKQGAFQIYTGEGKGKSTASMGLMLRALGCGFRVYYLRMMKPRSLEDRRTGHLPNFASESDVQKRRTGLDFIEE